MATSPPIVVASPAPSGGSSASIWPEAANFACASASGTPACSTAVRSPSLCSRISAIPPVSSSTATGSPTPPQSSFVRPPTGRTARPASPSERSSAAASSGEPGRSVVTSVCLGQRPVTGYRSATPQNLSASPAASSGWTR